MMTAQGRVIAVAGARAQVRIEPASGCSGCGSRGSCAGGKSQVIWVEAEPGVAAGDTVNFALKEGTFRSAAFLGYLLPAVTTLIGAALAAEGGDVASALGAAAGLFVGLLIVRILGRRLARNEPAGAARTTDIPTFTGGLS
jgi:sigma-E factor negative regulatory protein RseC